MVQGTIQLGEKRPRSKSLPCAKLRGFFYGGRRETLSYGTINNCSLSQSHSPCNGHWGIQVFRNASNWLTVGFPTRQHLIFYDNPSRKRVVAKISEKKVEQFAVKRRTEGQGLGLTAETIAVECKGHV